jgi:UDP-2,3-diacylglucosamine hydrolase
VSKRPLDSAARGLDPSHAAQGREPVGRRVERHVFVADVHLRREERSKRDALVKFISDLPADGVHLHLLGDLFNVWVGDVQPELETELLPVIEAMRKFIERGGKLTFFHGNRDYCMQDYLTRRIGAETVFYWKIIDLDGRRTYLTHGDLLSRGDQLYHVARWFMRGPISMRLWRLFPVEWRYGFTGAYRNMSQRQEGDRRAKRYNINRFKVQRLMRRGVSLVICGHVHEYTDRTYRHRGRETRIITLPPWREHGSALEYSNGVFVLKTIDFA